MTRESRTVDQSHQVDSPTQRHLPLVDLLVDTRAELMALAVASGLKVLTTMLEADRTALCGPRYQHQGERAAVRRHGTERGGPRRSESADSPAAGAGPRRGSHATPEPHASSTDRISLCSTSNSICRRSIQVAKELWSERVLSGVGCSRAEG